MQRYSEFKDFFTELTRVDVKGVLVPFRFPRKQYFGHSRAVLERRKQFFGALLNAVAEEETMLPELNYFLAVSEVVIGVLNCVFNLSSQRLPTVCRIPISPPTAAWKGSN